MWKIGNCTEGVYNWYLGGTEIVNKDLLAVLREARTALEYLRAVASDPSNSNLNQCAEFARQHMDPNINETQPKWWVGKPSPPKPPSQELNQFLDQLRDPISSSDGRRLLAQISRMEARVEHLVGNLTAQVRHLEERLSGEPQY